LLFSTAAITQNKAEEEVKKASDANVNAILHGDTKSLEDQYEDDYYRTGEVGDVIGKADFIKRVAESKHRPSNIELTDRKFRDYGDTVVETGTNRSTTERDGKSETHEFRYTVVWRKRNGTWRKAVYQATSLTPIPADAYKH
jgi:ketosteroid isomerase-like protein